MLTISWANTLEVVIALTIFGIRPMVARRTCSDIVCLARRYFSAEPESTDDEEQGFRSHCILPFLENGKSAPLDPHWLPAQRRASEARTREPLQPVGVSCEICAYSFSFHVTVLAGHPRRSAGLVDFGKP